MRNTNYLNSQRRYYILKVLILLYLSATNTVQCFKVPRQFESNDYYTVLGLKKHFAPAKEIKKSYHRLALKYHPDKVGNQNNNGEKQLAEAIFVKISEAYDVLGDEKLKKIYDRYGKIGLDVHKRGNDPEAAGFGKSNYYQYRNDRGSGTSSSYRYKKTGGGARSSPYEFEFNERNKNQKRHGSEFHFTAGGTTWSMNDWGTSSKSSSPLGIFLFVALALFMMIITFFVIFITLAIVFFPVTLFLIWRCLRKQ